MKLLMVPVIAFITLLSVSCSVKYSFTGASISTKTKSFQVNYFQNNSTLVEPGIDRDFTNKLIDLMINQTSLELVKSDGDLIFEGEIVEYRISPTTATANNTAAQVRIASYEKHLLITMLLRRRRLSSIATELLERRQGLVRQDMVRNPGCTRTSMVRDSG